MSDETLGWVLGLSITVGPILLGLWYHYVVQGEYHLFARAWNWVRVPYPRGDHDERLVDLFLMMIWLIAAVVIQKLWWDTDWLFLMLFPGIVVPMYISRRYIPNGTR